MKYDGYTSSQMAAYLNELLSDSIATLQFFSSTFLGPPNGWWSNKTIFNCFSHFSADFLVLFSNIPGYGALGLFS